MVPDIALNYLAILVCVIVSAPLGFLWFGPVFGKAWAKEMGMDYNQKPDPAQFRKSIGIHLFGNILIVFVLAHSLLVWQPSSWGLADDTALWVYALNAAMWVWLGYFVPVQLGKVAWEDRSWKLFLINSSHDMARLLVFSFILAYM